MLKLYKIHLQLMVILTISTLSYIKMQKHMILEWQAMALCGEIMIPYEKCKDYSFKQIVSRTDSSDEQTKYFLRWVVKPE